MGECDEQVLIERSIGGDFGAYSALVRLHQAGIRAALAVRLHDVSMADDLAQEAFVIAFNKLDGFEPGRSFGGWVRGIALNCFRNYLRKRKLVPMGDAAALDALVSARIERVCPAEGDRSEELFDRLAGCLKKLAGQDRELIDRRYFANEPIASIREDFGMGHSAVTMRLYRLRAALRQCIEGGQPLEERL